MTDKWQDASLSLGERCVAFAENEMNNSVKEDVLHSYTSKRIKEYFSICTRNVKGKEININFSAGNWCAAGASFCLYKSILPKETLPHQYRLGVVEIVSDLQHNNLYYTISDVKNLKYIFKKGDVVIFDRSVAGNPSSTWWRHIGRVYNIIDANTFQCISGNSGGSWKITNHNLSQSNLLGFGKYPILGEEIIINNKNLSQSSWDNVPEHNLAPPEDTGSGLDLVGKFYDEFDRNFPTKF